MRGGERAGKGNVYKEGKEKREEKTKSCRKGSKELKRSTPHFLFIPVVFTHFDLTIVINHASTEILMMLLSSALILFGQHSL